MADTPKPQPGTTLQDDMIRNLCNEMQETIGQTIGRYASACKSIRGDDFAMLLAGSVAGIYPLATYETALAYRRERAEAGSPMQSGEEVQLEIQGDTILFVALAAAASLMISGALQAGKERPFPHPLIGAFAMLSSIKGGHQIPAWLEKRVAEAERYEEILRQAEAMGNGQTQGNA